ncbi:hypothetical protein ACHAXR_007803 [Thalassiosira sp. AJA248-18]
MSNLTDDEIEALAAGSAKRSQDILNLESYLGDDVPPNAAQFTPPAATHPTSKISKAKYHDLGKRTNELISDYNNFMSEMDMATAELGLASSSDDQLISTKDGDDTEISSVATREGVMHRPWARGEPAEEHPPNLAPINLATIEEDNTLAGSSIWPNYPGLGFGYNEYDDDNRKKAYKFRFASCRNGRTVSMVTSFCAIALLAAILSLVGKKKQQTSGDALLDGYPSDIIARPPTLEEDDPSNSPRVLDYQSKVNMINTSVRPLWFSASEGWTGASYNDGVAFCQSISESRYVCPYDVYCPGGPGMPPFQGIQGIEAAEIWATVWDDQPLMVGVGSMNTCLQTGILDDKPKYILCCGDGTEDHGGDSKQQSSGHSEGEQHDKNSKPTSSSSASNNIENVEGNASKQPPSKPTVKETPSLILTHNEQAALDYMNPLWYGRKDGYQGTTHQEADDFCKSVGDRHLCLAEAYCPNGSPSLGQVNPQPLFLRMEAFSGEQWAPTSLNINSWLLIGTVDGDAASTCQVYEDIHGGAQPIWGFDGTSTELKENILCCLVSEK